MEHDNVKANTMKINEPAINETEPPQTGNFELFPDFDADDDIPNDQILDVLTQIEKENSIVNNQNVLIPAKSAVPAAPKTFNFSNVSNISNIQRPPIMPTM